MCDTIVLILIVIIPVIVIIDVLVTLYVHLEQMRLHEEQRRVLDRGVNVMISQAIDSIGRG